MALAFAVLLIGFKSNDAETIRKLYKFKDKCYQERELKKLYTTDLPTFHAFAIDGTTIPRSQIDSYMKWRFANQVSCRREERPVKIMVAGKKATVHVFTTDEFSCNVNGKLKKEKQSGFGISQWVKTEKGWKQASLRFVQKLPVK